MTNPKHSVTREAVLKVIEELGPISMSDIYDELDEQSNARYGEDEHRQIQVELAKLEQEGVIGLTTCQATMGLPQPGHGYTYQLKAPTSA